MMLRLVIFVLILHASDEINDLQCVTPVKSCPHSRKKWEIESLHSKCANLSYVCMLTTENRLVETCIFNFAIRPGKSGCPMIAKCFSDTPVTTAYHKECPTNVTGCPPANHTGYSIADLYQYPQCISNKEWTESNEDHSGSTDDSSDFTVLLIAYVFSTIMIAVLLIEFLRRRTYSRIRSLFDKKRKKEYIPLVPNVVVEEDIKSFGLRLLREIAGGEISVCETFLNEMKNQQTRYFSNIINFTEKGTTPLSLAVSLRKKDIISLLLQEGANFEQLNEANENPIQQGIFHTTLVRTVGVLGREDMSNFLQTLLTENKNRMEDTAFNRFEDVIQKIKQEYEEVPDEILEMRIASLSCYRRNLKKGSLPSFNIRCMVVGHYGVGKTTLVRGLLNKSLDDIKSTDGIEIYKEMCYIDRGVWKIKGDDQAFHSEDILGIEHLIQVDFWDFAGQAIYYSTHPTYFSDQCLYLLVINVALNSKDEVNDIDMDPSKVSKRNVMDFLMHWIGTIFYYSGQNHDRYPRIAIVGTHEDQVEDRRNLLRLEEQIKRTFDKYIKTGQLICRINNFVNAKCLSDCHRQQIRSLIHCEGKTYPNFGYRVPTSWVDIQRKLRYHYKDRCISITSVDDLRRFIRTQEISISDEDLSLFLQFYAGLGQILYFEESSLNDYVILEPIWLINAMKSLITKDEHLKHVHEIGKITQEEIWECLKNEDPQYVAMDNWQHVMKVLDKLDLVCNPKSYDKEGSNLSATFYYIPSLFTESGLGVSEPEHTHIESIIYSFESHILPPAVYHRIVCSFLSRWKVHEKHLYTETVQLQIQDDILVRFRRRQDQFLINVYLTQGRNLFDIADITSMIHYYVLETFDRIIRSYTRSYKSKRPNIIYEGDLILENIYKEGTGSSDEPEEMRSTSANTSKNDICCTDRENTVDSESEVPLTDIHLLRISRFLTKKQHDDLLRDLDSSKDKISYLHSNLNDDDNFLLVLNEWRTSVLNDGKEAVANLLCGKVGQEVLHKALNHTLPEANFLSEEVKTREVSDEFLDSAAYRIGVKYFRVGVSLGLEIDEVIIIVNDNPMQTLKINQEILQAWSRKEKKMGRMGTYGKLASVFIDANCRTDDFRKKSLRS